MAIAEAAVANDALGGFSAVLGVATNLFGRHDAGFVYDDRWFKMCLSRLRGWLVVGSVSLTIDEVRFRDRSAGSKVVVCT